MPSSGNANHFAHADIGLIIGLALALGALFIALILFFTYIASVLRFVLFDAVLTGRYRIREGWRMWRERALPYFRLQLLVVASVVVGLIVIVGIPAGIVFLRGGFAGKSWPPSTILVMVAAALLAIVWIIAIAIFMTLAKDFMLPMMALEGLDYDESWRRLREMLLAEKKNYALYILMKIVLSLAGAVLMGLTFIVALLAFAIPTGIAAAVLYFGFKVTLADLAGKLLLGLAIVLLVALIVAMMVLVSAPIAVFFPAYSIYFFAGRYQPLQDVLTPPAPPEAPPSPPEPAPAY